MAKSVAEDDWSKQSTNIVLEDYQIRGLNI